MKPFFYYTTANFGDALNHWLWQELIPDLLDPNDGMRLVGVGTLIKSELAYVAGLKVIFGTGAGYGSVPELASADDFVVRFVRGPLTAKALGLTPDAAITDAAWLVARLPEFSPPNKRRGTLFVPHWTTALYGRWKELCDEAGIEYVDPTDDCKTVLKRIASAELVIAEAMHAAIMADCFRTPWVPVTTSSTILPFKWNDWCSSIGVEYKPAALPLSDSFEGLLRKSSGADSESIKPTATPGAALTVKNAGHVPRTYQALQRAKPMLRQVRKLALQGVEPLRSVWALSPWSRRRQTQQIDTLRRLATGRRFLSEDSTHQSLMDRLDEAVYDLVRDYHSGALRPRPVETTRDMSEAIDRA